MLQRSSALLDHRLVNGLRLAWIVVVLWCELGTFYYSLADCRWPDATLSSITGIKQISSTHVLIVADPQILDHRSYPGRHPWLMALSQFIVDLNIRKSWRVAQQRLVPHAVVFLGDMMDSGRVAMPDSEYEAYYRRFMSIFQIRDSIPVHYLPGNHDIGLGVSPSFSAQARDRYTSHFGSLNSEVSIGNHSIILLDAPGLVEEDYQRAGRGLSYDQWAPRPNSPIAFVKSFATREHRDPVILFSHIPLSRSESASCGPLREKGTIRRGVGYGYQNTLGKETSTFLLESTRPSIVFSGDDHDYCEHLHSLSPSSQHSSESKAKIREVTVKSFSMAMGIRKPGFQLLSLIDPHSTPTPSSTLSDMPCLLPDQLGIYLSIYVPFVVVTLFILLVTNLYRLGPHHTSTRSHSQSRSPTANSRSEDAILVSSSQGTSHLRARLDIEDSAIAGTSPEHQKNIIDNYSTSLLPTPGSIPRDDRRISRARATILWTRRLSRVVYSVLARRGVSRGRIRRGFLSGFFSDMMDVAMPPFGVLVLITWWNMS